MSRAQQVLTMTTSGPGLRSEATGWGAEDPSLLRPGHIGMTPGFREPYTYPTVMHALADGWQLLAPPTREDRTDGDGEPWTEWEWWLVRVPS